MTVIHDVRFLISSPTVAGCPPADRPEYAFVGRSNVGKSSLINMLMERKKLAKTSSVPGKTQLINHFIVNEDWYLVDLPGYGWAKVPKYLRKEWGTTLRQYLAGRDNLACVFVLIDSRLPPQKVDTDFMADLAMQSVPFVLVFTKADKQTELKTEQAVQAYRDHLLETWEELPTIFLTSSEDGRGRKEILQFIAEVNKTWREQEAASASVSGTTIAPSQAD